MSQIDIFEATSCKPEYVAAVNRLLLQLCSSPCEMSAEQLQNLVNEPNSRLLLLTVDGEVMGMCTVGFYQKVGFERKETNVYLKVKK